ncbi:Clavaminate synthase-like protein [Venturia nashicola]|uniref:Clavaminate synthase-like protein n=1 Tax=Venturia nashicola TaxID=86259 RepID=A0A4Z1P0Q1_9PEZI|nr:Clavaminate synthase-like protein [Venturia nashicola]
MAKAVEKDGLAIPLIDFSTFLSGESTSKKQTAQAILHAFQTSGFIYLSNHGIQNLTVETAFQKSASFFDRPQEQKDALSWYSPEANRGYTAHGREKVTQLVDKDAVEALRAAAPDLKESLEIGRDDEEGMPNMWPSGDEEAVVFKKTMLAFFDECKELHRSVMRALALGLGIGESWFDGFTDRGDNTLRLLHYPSVSKDVFRKNQLQVRAGSHTDYGSITLLFQDSRGGLQVESPNGTFVDATPIPGTIVVNAGDLLARWSNETIKSTTHRVVEPPPRPEYEGLETYPPRYSIAYFCNPNFDKLIETIPTPLTKSQLFAKLDEAEAKMASQVEPAQSTPSTAMNNDFKGTVQPVASSATTSGTAETPSPGCGPQDFTENSTLYHLPTNERLEEAFKLDVLDKDGQKHNFGELCHNGGEGVQRNLVIFIRHWFCGVCQTYISALTSSLPPSTLSSLTPPTRLTIIGCGAASLIPQYLKTTSCPYTLYTDPTTALYKMFNFGRTLEMGKEPGYLKGKTMWGLSFGGVMQTIKTGWKARGGGDWMQVGGEFLFVKDAKEGATGGWNCEWAHRMRTTRDHAEVEELKELLGMKGGEMEEKKA